ncbi:hypothetical protein CS022_20545 [Veronia nyctiphanis]|uniref:PAS domain-containing protein n=1 Tax=Veronia nyctiphanis TaxID=1278244 RepID=A0A4Q0YLM3_9GAMM|nr:PAS domain-containing protein [Veronia nyctiphanis]RXJ71596.1 hypothetical protein CS022_20545 [Veronia nyctiphanis]
MSDDEFDALNRMLDIIQHIDVGVIVLNKNLEIELWNSFMTHHTGFLSNQVKNKRLFEVFPTIDQGWFMSKISPAFEHKVAQFSLNSDREPYFLGRSTRPITGKKRPVRQDVTFKPLTSLTGKVSHIGVFIYHR